MGPKREISKNSDPNEYLDLVNKNDEVIGKMKRTEVYRKKLSNFRVINAFLINLKGQIWIPRRVANKRIFPFHLDASMAGHVMSGETYDLAFKRELREELNIDANKVEFRLLGKVTPYEDNTSCFSSIYEIKANRVPDYNTNDFTEYFWLTPKEVLKKINNGDNAKSDLSKLVNIFYL